MPTLFTIGYERRTQAELVRDLSDAGVVLLADVRELPLSRRKGFSKTALALALAEGDIAYEHRRALGSPKAVRDVWKGGDMAAGRAGYRAHLLEVVADVDAFALRVAEGGVCVLCVEHEPENCHRRLLAQALGERIAGLAVRDL